MKAPYFVASLQPINIFFFFFFSEKDSQLPHILEPSLFPFSFAPPSILTSRILKQFHQSYWLRLCWLSSSFHSCQGSGLSSWKRIECCLPFFSTCSFIVCKLTSALKILLKVKDYKSHNDWIQWPLFTLQLPCSCCSIWLIDYTFFSLNLWLFSMLLLTLCLLSHGPYKSRHSPQFCPQSSSLLITYSPHGWIYLVSPPLFLAGNFQTWGIELYSLKSI